MKENSKQPNYFKIGIGAFYGLGLGMLFVGIFYIVQESNIYHLIAGMLIGSYLLKKESDFSNKIIISCLSGFVYSIMLYIADTDSTLFAAILVLVGVFCGIAYFGFDNSANENKVISDNEQSSKNKPGVEGAVLGAIFLVAIFLVLSIPIVNAISEASWYYGMLASMGVPIFAILFGIIIGASLGAALQNRLNPAGANETS